MSFVDKFKKILFDDVEEENSTSEQLPERSPKPKRVEEKRENTGFIEYHHEEENPITELKVPKEEEVVEEEKKPFNFPQDVDFEPEIPTRSKAFDTFDMDFMQEEPEETKFVKEVNSYNVNHEEKHVERQISDYRKMLSNINEDDNTHEKKPFTNTPVISPVWGILDKNYKPEEIVDRTEALTKVNTGATPRSYGPVSYNDQPLVPKKAKVKEEKVEEKIEEQVEEKEDSSLKEELVELNTTISDLINETVNPTIDDTSELAKAIEEIVDEDIEPKHSLDDVVIKTDNYDEFEDVFENNDEDSIETPQKANNNIEDAFESTSEFDSINESDAKEEDDELVDFDSIVNKKPDDEDDSGLDNTIETDLFNLIDSMYKDNEDE